MGLEVIDTVTGLALLETTTGLGILAVGPGLELLPTVTGLKLFPSGLETLLALVVEICVGLSTSARPAGFVVLEILKLSTWEISEVTVPPSSICWIVEY